MPAQHSTVFPLRRYSFIGGAATLLVVLVSWVAVRSAGPVQHEDRVPLLVQPTIPLAIGGPTLIPLVQAPPLPPSPTARNASSPASPAARKVKASRPPSKAAPKPTTKPAPPPAPPAAFSAHYTTGASWDQGFIGAVAVTNKFAVSRPWTVKLTFDPSAGVRIGNTWNGRLSRDGDTFVFTGDPLAPGATANLGFEASKQVRPKIQPTTCTVDGAPCRIG